jgi:citrate synthase
MDVLGIATTALGGIEKKYMQNPDDLIEKAAFLTASVAITVSYRYTKAQNNPWLSPKLDLPYAEQILFQMHAGKGPARLKKLGKILNMIMILHAEHGQNCSAATVRSIASAKGSIYSGVAGGMASFNGIIHGGASQLVSEMYEELLKNDLDVDSYVLGKIAKKELLMGFGQRTYNRLRGCWDPRVETMYRTLTDPEFDFPEVADHKRAAIALINRVVNDPFFKARGLTPNPDLFNCIFYKLFGAPKEMNTVMLGLGRIAGWTANFIEHTKDNIPLTRPCDIEK